MERRIKLVLSYDGTEFSGWQRQKGDRSVQGELEAALERMHGHPVGLRGAGRTDSGVHAHGQVADFATDIASIPPGKFVPALNSLLPPDVRVLEAGLAPDGFHSRFDAVSRSYRYFLLPGSEVLATDRLYAWALRRRPDLGTLNRMAALLCGEIDFTAFCQPKDESLSRCRYVHSASFFQEGRQLVFSIRANAFLWRMVRSLVGSMIHYEASGDGETLMRRALESRDRRLAGPTAPAHGLFLWSVEYPPSAGLAARRPSLDRLDDAD